MLKNRKIIVVLLVFMLFFISIFTVRCSAFSIDIDNENVDLPDLPDTVKDKIFFIGNSGYSSDGDYFICFYNGDREGVSAVYNIDGQGKVSFVKDNNALTMSRYIYYKSNGVWQNLSTRPDQSIKGGNIYYSNSDILNVDGTIFFHKPETVRTVLAPVLGVVEMDKVLVQIIQILPMILVVVVSLVGLRKAWLLLSKILHQA